MQDRDIVNDLLGGAKASINSYTVAIVESSSQQLRSTFQTLRDEAEQMHYQLFQMAQQKGYYMPAPPAHQEDVQKVKSTLSASINTNTNNTNMKNTNNNIYSNAGVNNASNTSNPSMVSSTENMHMHNNNSNNNMTNSVERSNSKKKL